jgi:2-oxoisovalerate dehydrogenase E2 component (dihydrolipoyl transacylase)
MIDFKLPDLGEGLQEAEIREWLVKAGDDVAIDQPLVSVETDKAVVEVPSPRAGRIAKLHGAAGDRVDVGAALVSYEGDAEPAPPAEAIRDTGVVVGAMRQSDDVVIEKSGSVGGSNGLKVIPAVRALARRLDVDLTIVTPTGPDGVITAADVQRVHKILTEVGPLEPLRGPRRAMARAMSQARDEVMPTSVTEDAVLQAWGGKPGDLTIRLIRALIAGVKREPALNAWFDQTEVGRRQLKKIHLGIAVDTPEGLLVVTLRDVAERSDAELRAELVRIKTDAQERRTPQEELRGNTLTLSNFGRFGGKYATPAILPPTVAIVAAGAVRDAVVPINGQIAIAPVLPLSVTFDHRAVTGGEATRFLAAVVEDLQAAVSPNALL